MKKPSSVSVHTFLRSIDTPGLFLALVVCGYGHCWCRVHGCAPGCLRGQAAAQGDKIWVRRLFLLHIAGREGLNNSAKPKALVVLSPLTYLHHFSKHSEAHNKGQKTSSDQE